MIDRETVKAVRADLEAALNAVAEKHNLEGRVGRMSYGASINGRFEMFPKALSGTVNTATPEATAFARFAPRYGIDPDKLGVLFTVHGEDYVLLGLKTSRPSYPLEVRRFRDGKVFKMAALPATVEAINASNAKV